MPETLFLIPMPGLQVRDPVTAAPLPAEGAEKPATAYWWRRLREGSVTEGRAPAVAAPSKNKQPKE